MLEFGKRYTWDEIVKAYPSQYAFIKDAEYKNGEIISAVFLAAATFEERGTTARRLLNEGCNCSCLWTVGETQEGVFFFGL